MVAQLWIIDKNIHNDFMGNEKTEILTLTKLESVNKLKSYCKKKQENWDFFCCYNFAKNQLNYIVNISFPKLKKCVNDGRCRCNSSLWQPVQFNKKKFINLNFKFKELNCQPI